MKSGLVLSVFITFLFPLVSFAQIGPANNVQEFSLYILTFANYTLLPFLFALALLFFIFNIVRYFIVDINNYGAKERAKNYALWSIIAFVVMVCIWGITNLFANGMGLGREDPLCPDYITDGSCQAPTEYQQEQLGQALADSIPAWRRAFNALRDSVIGVFDDTTDTIDGAFGGDDPGSDEPLTPFGTPPPPTYATQVRAGIQAAEQAVVDGYTDLIDLIEEDYGDLLDNFVEQGQRLEAIDEALNEARDDLQNDVANVYGGTIDGVDNIADSTAIFYDQNAELAEQVAQAAYLLHAEAISEETFNDLTGALIERELLLTGATNVSADIQAMVIDARVQLHSGVLEAVQTPRPGEIVHEFEDVNTLGMNAQELIDLVEELTVNHCVPEHGIYYEARALDDGRYVCIGSDYD